jgi:tRNA modification GTPase
LVFGRTVFRCIWSGPFFGIDVNYLAVDHTDGGTIVAIATPIGSSGIGIVRISGENAIAIAQLLFCKNRNLLVPPGSNDLGALPSHQLKHGYIFDPDSRNIVDEVLLTIMRAPHSYTRQDVVEIQSHSGAVILGRILKLVMANGARLAMPGEFTRRAFLNGRIDLTQAEAVGDMIAAKSEDALKLAVTHLTGHMKETIGRIVENLSELLAELEAGLEFGDELESPDIDRNQIDAAIQEKIVVPIETLIAHYHEGYLIRDGVRLGIAGRPNVGKSSLLNYLIKKDRAIVTPLPGTTRDLIEEHLSIDGLPIIITDTAGLHDTQDPVEMIGIQKTRESIDQADLVLFMIDGAQPFVDADDSAFGDIGKKRTILVINKVDLIDATCRVHIPERYSECPAFFISAKFGNGIEALKNAIKDAVLGDVAIDPQRSLVPNLRQKLGLEAALDALGRVGEGLDRGAGEELLLIDLAAAKKSLDEIIGNTHDKDILDEIFSRFCIGK